jgi:23S rRNA pseudouridine2605 synthase
MIDQRELLGAVMTNHAVRLAMINHADLSATINQKDRTVVISQELLLAMTDHADLSATINQKEHTAVISLELLLAMTDHARSFSVMKPKRTYSSDKPRTSSSDDRPRRSFSDDRPKRTYNSDRPRPASGDDKPRRSFSDDRPKRTYSSDRPRPASGDDKPRRSFSDDRPKRTYSSDRPRPASGEDKPRRSFSDDRPKRAYDSDRPRPASGEDKPRRSFSDDRPKREYNSDRPRPASGEDKPRRSFSDDRPKREYNSDRPRPASGEDKPRRSFSDDRPKRAYDSDRPKRSYDNDDAAPRRKRRDVTAESPILTEIVEKRILEGRQSPKRQKILSLEYEELHGPIRLNKYISNAGVCSRREADTLIEEGLVTVNGVVITEMGSKVLPTDEVRFGDKVLQREKPVYLLLNKPKDFITTMDDEKDRKHVLQLIQGACKERVYPVGRLDKNTTGLLLFTNDGDLTKKLTHPKHEVRKVYYVELEKNLALKDFESIANGLELEDGEIKVDEIAYVGDSKKEVGITIHSGRNRIVRRIFESLGYDIVKLDRVVFAGLTKKDLPRGDWRLLTQAEINILKMTVK